MKKILIIAAIAALFACALENTGFAEELPVFNQPPSAYLGVYNKFYNEEEKIWKALEKEEERGEEETREEFNVRLEQEYKDRLTNYYQKTRTIYFFEKRHYSYRDEYDPASQALVIHPFDYRTPFIAIEDLNYLNALNFDEFSDFGAVSIPMSAEEAEKTTDNLTVIIGIEFIYDTESPEGLAYQEEKYVPRFGSEKTVRYLDVYLRSVTVYDSRTDEILAQKHIFENDSPAWQFERKIEEDDDISTTCFIQTIISP